jgi:hypothetical protein
MAATSLVKKIPDLDKLHQIIPECYAKKWLTAHEIPISDVSKAIIDLKIKDFFVECKNMFIHKNVINNI